MSVKVQTAAIAFVALGIGSLLLVLAAQRIEDVNFAAVAKLLGLATGFVLLVLFVIAMLALLSERVSRAIKNRLSAMGLRAKETSRNSDPFLILVPIALVFLIETQAAESGNFTVLARSVLAITAISGALAHMRFNNGKLRWRTASLALVLAGPIAFWWLVVADKVSIASFDNDHREGVLANGWDFLSEMSTVSSNLELAAASGSAVLMIAGLLWVFLPRNRTRLFFGRKA